MQSINKVIRRNEQAKPQSVSSNREKTPVTWGGLKRWMATRQEEKYKDTSTAYAVQDYNATIVDLTNISQGDTDTTRDGDQVLPTRLELRGQLHGADATNTFRIIIFRWKSNSQSTLDPTYPDILQSVYAATSLAPLAPYYHDGRTLFDVLYDQKFDLAGDVGNSNYVRGFQANVHLKNHPIQFTDTNAGVNKLYMLYVSDSSAPTHPAIEYIARVFFTDS